MNHNNQPIVESDGAHKAKSARLANFFLEINMLNYKCKAKGVGFADVQIHVCVPDKYLIDPIIICQEPANLGLRTTSKRSHKKNCRISKT